MCNQKGTTKSVTFLLPHTGKNPVGGYKVVYEYANRLVNRGYKVNVVYPVTLDYKNSSLKNKIKSILIYVYYKIYSPSCRSWFNLNSRVKEVVTLSLNYFYVPNSDIYIATAYQTSTYLKEYKVENRSKFYLIQDFENWDVSDNDVIKSYNFGLKNIVISKWLKTILEKNEACCEYIPNGFDFDYFRLENNIQNRDRLSISMLYHAHYRKGCQYGLEAIFKLRQKYPNLKVTLFGVPNRPKDLPEWIEYHQKPNRQEHNRIYNESSIFIAPSLSEGWGLTVGEAMICGVAIVCTDALGFKEMITDGYNGLICTTKNSDAIVEKVESLINNDAERIRIAQNGVESIKHFNWETSYSKFEQFITQQ